MNDRNVTSAAILNAFDIVSAHVPPAEPLIWEEDENGVVWLTHQDGTPAMIMRRDDFDRLRDATEERP